MPYEFDNDFRGLFVSDDDEDDEDFQPESDSESDESDSPVKPDSQAAGTGSDDELPVETVNVHHAKTRRWKKAAEEDGVMLSKVHTILKTMEDLNINLPLFLDAVSWGNEDCTRDGKVKHARMVLMHSEELPQILQHWWKPPKNWKRRATAGKSSMEAFAADCMSSVFNEELSTISEWLKSPAGDDTRLERLTELNFDEMIAFMRRDAPHLWKAMRDLAWTPKQEKENTMKDPDKIVLTIISILSYSRNHHRNKLQKMFAIYLKFKGTSAKAFDTLHALGLVMSHKWTANAVEAISAHAMAEVNQLVKEYPFLLSYDNIQLAFRVFSQRLDNHGEFGNGTAATVYIKKDAIPMTAEINRRLRDFRERGLPNPITAEKIFDLGNDSYPHIRTQMVYQVLDFLLNAPEFNLKTYSGKDSPALNPPPPVRQLPSGPDHITLQHLLGSVNIPEASYHDHIKLIHEWLTQLGMASTAADKILIAIEKIITFCGDQLTIDRLRGIFRFRASDSNSFDRFDWMVLVFGWFHLQMAFANSIHKQYLGNNKRGLKAAFTLLGRKGVQTTSIKGPFHHHLEEALYHIGEAHIHVDWLLVGKMQTLEELRKKQPEQLVRLAEEIVREHASSTALNRMNMRAPEHQDDYKREQIMLNRDILHYIVLDKAIKHGDVGLMEDMLPHLLYHFIGGHNSNYAIEVLELLQSLHSEWPPEVSAFVRDHCWLLNFSGLADAFVPVDQAQEHNIKDIKVTYRSEGPNIKWDYLRKLHPAIPVIKALSVFIEKVFGSLSRGKKHTTPQKDIDVKKLRENFQASTFHKFTPGRLINNWSSSWGILVDPV
ncbi:hypothetical protein C8J56DRAFT_1046070 [Mycena floridula]|nr:hypothetical protein C8J56DRAFT_1046070 [Mycena floridula]